MKLEEIVTSLELSKRLGELGVKQESLFYWVEVKKGKWECWELIHLMQHWECCHTRDEKPVNKISSFSIAELGELLPSFIDFEGNRYSLEISKDYETYIAGYFDNESLKISKSNILANTLAETLIYLIENNLLKL